MKACTAVFMILLFLVVHLPGSSQCIETWEAGTKKKSRSLTIPLVGKSQYITFAQIGTEKVFSYRNERIDLMFPVPMYTEIKFISRKGSYSLFTTSGDRTQWDKSFELWTPVTDRDIEQLKGASMIVVKLPEETKKYKLTPKNALFLTNAIDCVFTKKH